MNEAPSTHPDAEEQLEQIEDDRERIEEEEERLRRGELELPWPGSSWNVQFIGVLSFIAGGGAMGASLSMSDEIGLFAAGFLLLLSGSTLVITGRWMHDHFDIDPQPRYTEPTAADGGEDE